MYKFYIHAYGDYLSIIKNYIIDQFHDNEMKSFRQKYTPSDIKAKIKKIIFDRNVKN